MNIEGVWNNRFSEHIKELSRYARYMFNDHLMIVLLIALGAGAMYYKQWLTQLPYYFPYEWVIGIVLALVMTTSSIRTFLKEPDLVFLLPVEHKMNNFYQKGFNYSFVIHSVTSLLVFLPLIPMYNRFNESTAMDYILLILILFLLKGWNLLLAQRMFYFIEDITRTVDRLVRFIFNVIFLILLFGNAPFTYLLIVIIVAILWLAAYFYITKDKLMMKWDVLLKLESKQLNRFYRMANLFVDVPHLRHEVKPRRWLNFISSSIPFKKENVFDILFIKTFLRSGEYLGLYFRLLLIAGFLVVGINFPYAGLIIIPFFIYLSGLQLLPLYKEHDQKLWIDLYPLPEHHRLKSFLRLLLKLMVVKGVVLSIMLLTDDGIVMGACGLIITIVFSYLYVHYYLKNKLLKREQ